MKYLEVSDLHFSKTWSNTSIQCAEAVSNAAIENKVDFIAVPGDFFDSPILASDKGGMDIAQKIMKSWTDIVPVCGIQGTPSHDAPGCYGLFDGMNFTLLEPSKIYGYDKNTRKIITGEGADCILFGIPELNKSNIQAKLSLSAEEANAEAVNLFDQYIREFVGPMRLKYKDIPAIGLLHGNVSDSRQENSTDIIMRSSDIVIHTEILEQANLDRWSLGHIHTPWESERISAGYAGYSGIDHNPWGKRDFIPAMNLVETGQPITRIAYGTPGRIKITEPQSTYLPNFAYWLETDNPDAVLPGGIHSWSRITYVEQQTETRRVTAEQAEKAKTLWDMFKLVDAEVDFRMKDKIDSIPISRNNIVGNKLDAELTYVQIIGCDLFGEKTVEFDLNDLATGMNQLTGTNGNGDGKSSLLGMCSLYPCVVGKDTKSGRLSALKDFFSGQESSIHKKAIINGQHHDHLITIKGAHTQNPKTECYLSIDGVPQLEKATFDIMMEKCEELYGDYEDYLLTTFYEQPQQSKNQRSGLMTATMTEARNLVQNIAGIDRDSEKRYALDRIADCEKTEQQLQSDIDALEKYSEDMEQLKIECTDKISRIITENKELNKIESRGVELKAKSELLQLKHTENEKLKTQRTEIEKNITFVDNAIILSKTRILELKQSIQNLSDNQSAIEKDNEVRKLKEQNDKLKLEYSTAVNRFNRFVSTYDKRAALRSRLETEQQSIIDNAERAKQSYNKEIELISEPCPQCGYIKPDVKERIDHLNKSIVLQDETIKNAFDTIEVLKPVTRPNITKPDNLSADDSKYNILTDFDRAIIQDIINDGLKAETEIEGLESGMNKDKKLIEEYNKSLSGIIIDNEIDDLLLTVNNDLSDTRKQYTDIKSTMSTLEAEKESIEDRMIKAEVGEQELKTKRNVLGYTINDHTDWTYIAKMLNPDKIPALELDIILDSIDAEATRNIEPFLEGRYSFHTETQSQGKKSTVDKFDVLIHDAESGRSFSMFYTNPGNKAFYSDCYIKALIRKRNERQQRSYSPIIYDEADGPVNPIRVKAYYDIQQAYFKNEKVIIVSQKDISASYVEKVFNIEDMKS